MSSVDLIIKVQTTTKGSKMVLSQEQWTRIIQASGTTEDVRKVEAGEAQIDWEALER
jgi:hypothetical protein